MSTEESKSNRFHKSQAENPRPEPRDMFSYCGPWWSGGDPRGNVCPCFSFFRGSRRSFIVPLAIMGILCAIVFTGWVLGVLAFFNVI